VSNQPISPSAIDATRRQLAAARDETARRLVKLGALDGGLIALLGSFGAALDALDHLPVRGDHAERAIVSDDGLTIRLTLYHTGGVLVAGVDLDPLRAIGLAGELIEAAHRKLGR
jgi:hypothetical protein